MEIRDIKREVKSLPCLKDDVKGFRNNYLKPIRADSNKHMPFLKDLDNQTKEKLNELLKQAHLHLDNLEQSHVLNDKLEQYSRHLVELKLAHFRGDEFKSKVLTKQLATDPFLNLRATVTQVKQTKVAADKLSSHYEEINDLLHKELPLEHALFFMQLPHQKFLSNLIETSKSHEKITRNIARHFVKIAAMKTIPKSRKK